MRKIIIFTTLICLNSVLFSQTRIKMQKESGIYTVPCIVNGLKLRFIFDTGASNVCISISEATFMLKNGYLDKKDIVGKSKSQIADGSLVENTHIILREIEIAGMKLYNIDAVVMNKINAPLLLGQSAIQKLGKIQLEGEELVIINLEDLTTKERQSKVTQLLLDAEENLNKEMYLTSFEKFSQAYETDEKMFTFMNYLNFAYCCNMTDNKEMRIKLLNFAYSIKEDANDENWRMLNYMYILLTDTYEEEKQFNKALLYLGEGINLTQKYNKNWDGCQELANLQKRKGDIYYYGMKNKYMAKDIYGFSLELWGYFKFKGGTAESRKEKMSALLKDVDKGRVKDEWLGELLWRIGLCQEDDMEGARWIKGAARLGYQQAIDFVNKTTGFMRDYFNQ